MSKVRINDLARELEVKPRAILDILPELGVEGVKTHSSSLELDEAEKVRARFAQDAKPAAHAGAAAGRHAAQTIVPKIDLSHISKPGDVLKAILAKKKEERRGALRSVAGKAGSSSASQTCCACRAPGHCGSGTSGSGGRGSGCGSSGSAQDRSAATLCSAYYCPGASHACHRFASSRRRRCSQGSRSRHSCCAAGGRGCAASGCSGG